MGCVEGWRRQCGGGEKRTDGPGGATDDDVRQQQQTTTTADGLAVEAGVWCCCLAEQEVEARRRRDSAGAAAGGCGYMRVGSGCVVLGSAPGDPRSGRNGATRPRSSLAIPATASAWAAICISRISTRRTYGGRWPPTSAQMRRRGEFHRHHFLRRQLQHQSVRSGSSLGQQRARYSTHLQCSVKRSAKRHNMHCSHLRRIRGEGRNETLRVNRGLWFSRNAHHVRGRGRHADRAVGKTGVTCSVL